MKTPVKPPTFETNSAPLMPSMTEKVRELNPVTWGTALSALTPQHRKEFLETWTLCIHDPSQDLEAFIEFTALLSRNGFREIAETRVTFRSGTQKSLIRTPVSLASSSFTQVRSTLSIQESELNCDGSKGEIQGKGQSFRWNLSWDAQIPSPKSNWTWLSSSLTQFVGTESQQGTLWRALSVNGSLHLGSESWTLSPQAKCSLIHHYGRKNWIEGTWALAPLFQEESGKSSDLSLEGGALSAEGYSFTRWAQPRVFRVHYKGKTYSINSLIQSLQTRSQVGFPSWSFETHAGGYRFVGEFSGELKNTVGISLENTNGKIQYLTRMLAPKGTVRVYRGGKLEGRFHTLGGVALEFRTTRPIAYVGSYL